ncbi:MAG: NAD-dependent DNA ligase LigA [Sphaerochaetaceae bacterium]|nr:NAD-dependent DNA ligase LigA [Sphaerochaetaceae bacterium]MDC7248346.1 NAD-dependent DNA ligase LigA [Sphaerochaetaceae bacterium]
MNNKEKLLKEVHDISNKLRTFQKAYYIDSNPLVSDMEYDRLFDRLVTIERENPELKLDDSPTQRVGSDLDSDFEEVEHTIPVLSLDKAYSGEEIISWINKCQTKATSNLNFVLEQKIDGISIVLYYEKGILKRAVTRGNGAIGNDVTNNVRTIKDVPLRLTEEINVAVRGEIYLSKKEFEKVNKTLEQPFANPRNLCAGTIRRKKSSESAKIPLNIFIYEGFFEKDEYNFNSHIDILAKLKQLGFRINPSLAIFSKTKQKAKELLTLASLKGSANEFDEIYEEIKKQTETRDSLEYEIDGLVVKVNEIEVREALGYTVHHPRWAMAYKFESPFSQSVVESIDIQVGRTGRLTPVARITPVEIGGSTVSNVTLHNQQYIDELELAIGDSVEVSKRGDVIPAVEQVIEKNEDNNTTYKMPSSCPICSTEVEIKGAHTFCPNPYCPKQVFGRLEFFVAKSQMDIDSLGPKTIEVLLKLDLVKDVQDLYNIDFEKLSEEKGFGEKKINSIISALEKSKEQPFSRVLTSLGIPEVGKKIVDMLIKNGFDSIDKLYELVDKKDYETLCNIPLIAEKTSKNIIDTLDDKTMRDRIASLKNCGLNMEENVVNTPKLEQIFTDQVWAVTGSFKSFNPRTLALEEVEKRGGRSVSSISSKTTHLLLGKGGGSKKTKAEALGVKIVEEEEFLSLLGSDKKKKEETTFQQGELF